VCECVCVCVCGGRVGEANECEPVTESDYLPTAIVPRWASGPAAGVETSGSRPSKCSCQTRC
jgi:hypothetical protein